MRKKSFPTTSALYSTWFVEQNGVGIPMAPKHKLNPLESVLNKKRMGRELRWKLLHISVQFSDETSNRFEKDD